MLRRTFVASITSALFADKLLAKPYFQRSSVAANGQDVLAYFSQNAPVPGDPAHSVQWDGAIWLFSSAENLALFNAEPQAYAPQYGGWCALAMSKNAQASTVAEAFTVHDNKLYLNNSLYAREIWLPSKVENIEAADEFWPNFKA